MAAAKKQTKKDLENKIAELEAKINKLGTLIDKKSETVKSENVKTSDAPKPAEVAKPKSTLPKGFEKPAPAPEPKPAEVAKPKATLPKSFEKPAPAPEPKPAEVAKPKATLPKGFEKPAPAPEPTEVANQEETASQPPATVQEALEDAYRNAPTTDFHQYRTNVTGYSPAPNRYFVRLTAPVGTVPTEDWNRQKVAVTGYTQPSNQYFATRPRLAYHPPDKTFGSFSGVPLTVEGIVVETQQTAKPKQKGTLPKGY